MNLERRLAEIRQAAPERIDSDDLETMKAHTEELVASDILADVLETDDRAPDFELPDSRGERVSLAGLLEDGPVVLTFFRGHW